MGCRLLAKLLLLLPLPLLPLRRMRSISAVCPAVAGVCWVGSGKKPYSSACAAADSGDSPPVILARCSCEAHDASAGGIEGAFAVAWLRQ